ncbi:MAG: hypothetical protein EXS50_02780 [Candidatus Taylorbacteria bacterium]|nr:hypothetical protein [Candidatus Taylorbacteria bacterium]
MKKIIVIAVVVLSTMFMPAVSRAEMSNLSLVEIFINAGIISPEKADLARSIVNPTVPASTVVPKTPTTPSQLIVTPILEQKLVIKNSASVPMQVITSGTKGQVLGGIDVEAIGTNATIYAMSFNLTPRSIISSLTNIVLYDESGNQVTMPFTPQEIGDTYPIHFYNTNVQVGVGKHTYTIKADLAIVPSNKQSLVLTFVGLGSDMFHKVSTTFPMLNTMLIQ